jgi:hypothetical protein
MGDKWRVSKHDQLWVTDNKIYRENNIFYMSVIFVFLNVL